MAVWQSRQRPEPGSAFPIALVSPRPTRCFMSFSKRYTDMGRRGDPRKAVARTRKTDKSLHRKHKLSMPRAKAADEGTTSQGYSEGYLFGYI